jgi:two-component system cell cycle sensor histidine kinase/response regulator CckA
VAEQEKINQLEEKVKALEKSLMAKEKVCEVLIKRVERSIDSVGGAYSIFERNILLQNLVDQRSRELEDANKKLSQEIHERIKSEQRLHSVIQGSPIPIFVIGKDHRVLYWNKALEELSRIKANESFGTRQHWRAFYSKERPCMADLLVDEILEAIPQWYSGKYVKSKLIEGAYEATDFFPELGNGGKWLHFTAASIRDSQGNLVGAIETLEDITENKQVEEARQRLEDRLRRAEKMELLGTLAGGVAHDLNNVLGVLIGYSELLLERVTEESPLRKYATTLLQSGQRGAAIVQDLLTLTRRGVAVLEVVNLNTIVSGYFKRPEFEKLKEYHPYLTFKTDLEKDLLNINGSPVHLEKTLMNLVSNAAEAISGNGEITVRTENRYVDKPIQGYDDLQEGDYAVLTVSDSGKGISSADIEKVFEPFFTKKVLGRSGTGLGLTVVWGTVKDHNGYIDIQSEVGKGSTFTLYFPVTRDDLAKDEKALSPETYMGRRESILVVDDVKEQRDLAVIMLNRLGYQVTSVSGGEEAFSHIKTNKVDLLVLDMIMDPGIDGLDTYKRILEINPKQKAIIVSGFSETDRVSDAQGLGAGAYVKKPYLLEKLGLAVRKELDRST